MEKNYYIFITQIDLFLPFCPKIYRFLKIDIIDNLNWNQRVFITEKTVYVNIAESNILGYVIYQSK